MVTPVNTQALASSVSASRTDKPDAEQPSKPLDSSNKGSVPVDDLQAAVVKISAEGARRAEAGSAPAPGAQAAPTAQAAPSAQAAPTAQAASAAQAAPSAQQVPDTNGDGKVSEKAFKDGVPEAPQTRVTVNPPRTGAAPAGGSATALSVGGASQTYEPADANEDGRISAQEQQAYDSKLASDKAAQSAASTRSSAEAGAAVKAYAAVEQLSKDSGTAAAA